jgi:predicted nuclease with TOPRIM domain
MPDLPRKYLMKQQLEQRIKELKAEFAAGQRMMADLETKQAHLRETLLRISGAIQVLEELLNTPDPAPNSVVPANSTENLTE